MNEGGQSSTGQLLDFMIDTHPASARLKQLAKEKGTNHFSLLTEILRDMAKEKKVPFMSYLTKDIQLYPDLHGKWVIVISGTRRAEAEPFPGSNVAQATDRRLQTMICGACSSACASIRICPTWRCATMRRAKPSRCRRGKLLTR